MSDTDNQKTTTPADPLELITKTGKLNYSIDRTVSIVRSYYPEYSKNTLQDLLTRPGSNEYDAYHAGKNAGLFDIENALFDAAASGDVDAQEALLKLQVDKDVTEAIKEKFFPDENTECE